MTKTEVATLLTLIAARDGRSIGQVEIEAWHEDVGRWDFPTAREAVRRHNARSREFLRPYDLTQIIREIRGERLDSHDLIVPPPELADDPEREIAWIRTRREAIASGRHVPPAVIEARPPRPEITGQIRALAAAAAVPARDGERETGREAPPATVDPATAAAMEAERRRQLDALQAITQPEGPLGGPVVARESRTEHRRSPEHTRPCRSRREALSDAQPEPPDRAEVGTP